MDIHAILTIAGFAVNFFLGTFILLRDPRSERNRLYSAFAYALSYWALMKFNVANADTVEDALFWYKLSGAGWCLVPALYIHFAASFTENREIFGFRATLPMIYLVGVAFMVLLWIGNSMVVAMVPVSWGYSHEPGIAYRGPFLIYFIGMFLVSMFYLARHASRARDHEQRMRSIYLLAGVAIPAVGGSVTNLVLPTFGEHPFELAIPLSTVNALIVAIAVAKYRLLSFTAEFAAKTIVGIMADCLFILDKDGTIKLTNDSASMLLDHPVNEIIGRNVNDVIFERCFDSILRGRIRLDGVARAEVDLVMRGGSPIPVSLSISSLKDDSNQEVGYVCIARDMREIRRLLSELEISRRMTDMAEVMDVATGVFNRRYILVRLREEFMKSRRNQQFLSVVCADIDRFGEINRTKGQETGDRLLRAVASMLRLRMRSTDLIGRYSSDEFVLVLPETDREEAIAVVERLRSIMKEEAYLDEFRPVTISYGITTANPVRVTAVDEEDFIREAKTALEKAKVAGKDEIAHFEEKEHK